MTSKTIIATLIFFGISYAVLAYFITKYLPPDPSPRILIWSVITLLELIITIGIIQLCRQDKNDKNSPK
jgi:ABC-type transport system involved in multi-copper enzyme maturation permease subunit